MKLQAKRPLPLYLITLVKMCVFFEDLHITSGPYRLLTRLKSLLFHRFASYFLCVIKN